MKKRVNLWIFLILIVFLFNLVKSMFISLENKKTIKNEEITIQLNEKDIEDKTLAFKLNNNEISKINPDLIIGENNNLPDYELIKDGFYTPIFLCYLNKNNIFNNYIEEINNNQYIDLTKFIKMIKDNNDYNYKIYFPDKYNYYYKTIFDLVVYSLNDFKEPTNEELINLKIEANKIIDKCNSYSNTTILKNLKEECIAFIPESETDRNSGMVIPFTTISKSYNLHINKTKKEKITDYLENNSDFYEKLRYRNIFMKYNEFKIYDSFIDKIYYKINNTNILKDNIFDIKTDSIIKE